MSTESTEFATEPVPDSHTVGWFRVALVAAMVAFSLPTFLTGLEISLVTSAQRTAQALLAGAAILTVIGCLTASIGTRTRLSSYMLNRIAFGSQGAALVNLAFALSLLGWFGVNIDLFSGAAQRLAADLFGYTLAAWPIELFAGVVMTITTVFGFRAINMLSMLLVPVLFAVTGLLIAGSLEVRPLTEILSVHTDSELAFGDAVSSVVGAVIIGAVILPDITRFIRHWHGAIYVVVIAYLIINFIVTSAGGLAAAALNDEDLLNIMITIGLGWAAFAIIIGGSWVLNSLNLYSTMLSVESTAPGLNNKVVVAVLGGLGTLAAFLNILDHFLSFLFYLAIVFIPVAGVIAVDYLFLRRSAYHDERLNLQKKIRPKAIIAWALGACIALLGSAGWVEISGVAAIDAMLVAALAYYLLARFGAEHSSPMAAKENR